MWTKAEDAELKRLWPTHSASEIAVKIGGKTRNAVIGRKHRIDGTYAGRHYADDIWRRRKMTAKRKAKSDLEQGVLAKMKADISRNVPRNVAIGVASAAGARLVAIGEVFGITRQAVSLVVRGQHQK